ncbi:hypothetical protein NPIL_6011, partial [Nephila pilipes]
AEDRRSANERQQLQTAPRSKQTGRQAARTGKAGPETVAANRRDADSSGRRQGRTHRQQRQQETTPDRTARPATSSSGSKRQAGDSRRTDSKSSHKPTDVRRLNSTSRCQTPREFTQKEPAKSQRQMREN